MAGWQSDLTAPKVDSVNTFEAPTAVAPKTVAARVQDKQRNFKAGAQVRDRNLNRALRADTTPARCIYKVGG